MDTTPENVKKAQELYGQLDKIVKFRDSALWDEARLWYELRKDGTYKLVFGDVGQEGKRASWKAFIQEVGIPLSTVQMKLRIYQFWVIREGFDPKEIQDIHIRKLDRAIMYLLQKTTTVKQVLNHARELSHQDFVIWLRGNEEPCWHPKEKRSISAKQIEVCEDCKKEVKGKK